MTRLIFKEEQKFTQPWLWFIIVGSLALVIILFGSGIYQQLILGIPYGDNPASDTGLIVIGCFSTLLMTGITILFIKMKLVVEIREDGIHYCYPFFINSFNIISKEEIENFEVRQYKPIKEYEGWGIKTGGKSSGKAYNVKGNIGLQLHLKNGKKILFGTQRRNAIHSAMQKMMSE